VYQGDALAEALESSRGGVERRGIPIDADEAPVGCGAIEDALGVARAAERGVAVEPTWTRRERVDRLFEEDGRVIECGHRRSAFDPSVTRANFRDGKSNRGQGTGVFGQATGQRSDRSPLTTPCRQSPVPCLSLCALPKKKGPGEPGPLEVLR
jgi:hypothetical protein